MYDAMKDEILSAMQNQLATLTTLVSHQAQNGLPMARDFQLFEFMA